MQNLIFIAMTAIGLIGCGSGFDTSLENLNLNSEAEFGKVEFQFSNANGDNKLTVDLHGSATVIVVVATNNTIKSPLPTWQKKDKLTNLYNVVGYANQLNIQDAQSKDAGLYRVCAEIWNRLKTSSSEFCSADDFEIIVSSVVVSPTVTPKPSPTLPPMPGEVLYFDNFESGNLSHKFGNAGWIDKVNVSVNAQQPKSGAYAAEFLFEGTPSLAADADAFAELRFDLAVLKPELWIEYDLFIPANYYHRKPDSSDNNKFFRLWGFDYGDQDKVGASLWQNGNGTSELISDWDTLGRGIGPKGDGNGNYISSADIGKWMKVKIHVIAATATKLGTLQIWKNDVLVINNDKSMDNYSANDTHAFRYGYILGWSNSGFTNTTKLYIDNIVFATSEDALAVFPY